MEKRNKRFIIAVIILLILFLCGSIFADDVADPVGGGTGFSTGDLITAADMNARFDALNSLFDVSVGAMTSSGGKIGIGTTSPVHLLDLGNSLGAKLAVYQNTDGASFYGFGISTSMLEIHAGSTTGVTSEAAMVVMTSGNVGIGTSSPSTKLHIKHADGGTAGLTIENVNGSHKWRLYSWAHTDTLAFYCNGTNYGHIDSTGFHNPSDGRRKENIKNLDSVLEGISLLKPVSYNFRNQDTDKRIIGFVAQEVEPVFPELVSYNPESDEYGINYSTFGVLAVKAIQEQQQQINALERDIAELRNMIRKLENK